MHIRWPQPINSWLIGSFAKMYRINLEEAEKPIEGYLSVGDFFVRKLKPHCRPVDREAFAVHPADAEITQGERICDGKMIQAKGVSYSLEDFCGDSVALQKWGEGHFLTYYLCPTDYHRVHSPVSGKIKRVKYFPGKLWPVNMWSVRRIKDLFCVNERVLVEIETGRGLVGLMMVGATNVGKMSLSFEERIQTNQPIQREAQYFDYEPEIDIQKGQEVGCFHMGSTVIMLYSKEITSEMKIELGRSLVGEALLRG